MIWEIFLFKIFMGFYFMDEDLKKSYWNEVFILLVNDYGFTFDEANESIDNYISVMLANGVGDILYHDSVEDSVLGIVNGEY